MVPGFGTIMVVGVIPRQKEGFPWEHSIPDLSRRFVFAFLVCNVLLTIFFLKAKGWLRLHDPTESSLAKR